MGLSNSKYSCTNTDDVVLTSDMSLFGAHHQKSFGSSYNKSSSLGIFASKSKVLPYFEEPVTLPHLAVTDSIVDKSDDECTRLNVIQNPSADAVIDEEEEEENAVEELENAIPCEPYKCSSYFSFENGDVLFLKLSHEKQTTNVSTSAFIGWECHVKNKGVGISRAAKWLSRNLHLLIHFGDGRREFIKVKSDDSKEYNVQDLLNGHHLPMNVTFLQRIFKV